MQQGKHCNCISNYR